MTQCFEEIAQIMGTSLPYADRRAIVDSNRWQAAKRVIGNERVTLGPQASQQWMHAPDHLSFVLARYRAAAALIGNAQSVAELGCGEGIGALILAKGRMEYDGLDPDHEAIAVAESTYGLLPTMQFAPRDHTWLAAPGRTDWFDAVVSLDVIEHIPAEREDEVMRAVVNAMVTHGVCVIGTPSASFDHLASPQSKAGHINTYTYERLHALMARHFHVVQMLGMQDTSIHLGHPDARHYHLAVGIGPR